VSAPASSSSPPPSSSSDVVALVVARERQARLRTGLRERALVRFVARCREVVPAVAIGFVSASLLELRDADGAPTAPTIRHLRAEYPRTPVLALAPRGAAAGHELVAVVQAGANGIILEGVEDEGVALLDAIEHAESECVARLVMAEVGPLLREEARPVVEYCLAQARRPMTVDDVAAALGACRRTLGRRLLRAGLPSPQATIGWCRLLAAAQAMEEGGRTLEQVALRLEFPGAASLRNMLLRYTGLRPRDVREGGGLRCVLAAFRRAVEAGRAREGPARRTAASEQRRDEVATST